MDSLRAIGERALSHLEEKNTARDRALQTSRILVRHSAHAIRAVHRGERGPAQDELNQARRLANSLQEDLHPYPDLYHAGYSQDALKEFAEASIVYALVGGEALPCPEIWGERAASRRPGEAAGELRRSLMCAPRQWKRRSGC
jgi:translin